MLVPVAPRNEGCLGRIVEAAGVDAAFLGAALGLSVRIEAAPPTRWIRAIVCRMCGNLGAGEQAVGWRSW